MQKIKYKILTNEQQSCALTPLCPLQRRPVCGKERDVGYHPTHHRNCLVQHANTEIQKLQIQRYKKYSHTRSGTWAITRPTTATALYNMQIQKCKNTKYRDTKNTEIQGVVRGLSPATQHPNCVVQHTNTEFQNSNIK